MAYRYMTGFGNEFATEAVAGALPQGQNSPQNCPFGLYAEQISGSAFTAPRAINRRSWLYRKLPSVRHAGRFAETKMPGWKTAPDADRAAVPPEALRWGPPVMEEEASFITGMHTMTTAGSADLCAGFAAHIYSADQSMERTCFSNADGEMLVVPENGRLEIRTELGVIEVAPGEIALIPRGIKFSVALPDGATRGYVCENYGANFTLPERGPIGANGLANSRDFMTPAAAFDTDGGGEWTTIFKWSGRFHTTTTDHGPFDVVAWHGNYAPCKYDLALFCPMGPVLFDHADPSIFTVLTAPSEIPGVANVDFVIFPERWSVAEHTFRPPWYHVNVMSEFMGLVRGVYDAKPEGFLPGGASLHNCMLPHGPDADAFGTASKAALEPAKHTDTLAIMFESRLPQHVTRQAAESPSLQTGYRKIWDGLQDRFDPEKP